MPSILDSFPFPWHNADAQQLLVTLTQLHPMTQDALLVAQMAGINTYVVAAQQAPTYLWKELLDEAARSGATRRLVQQVHDLLNWNSPMRPFLADLLADQPVSSDGEPRGAVGAPAFLRDSDDVTAPEALLYYDDLTIPVGEVPGLIATLQKLVALAPAICRLVVDINGQGQKGTAFRIGTDLLLTNWHVLHSKAGTPATAVTAEFGYEDDGSGGVLAASVVPCDVTRLVTHRVDDWAVLYATQPLKEQWPVVKLSEAAVPASGKRAFIVQHPGGEHKRVGFVRNQVSSFDDRVVHYLTDTQEGSSGSPVFNAQGQLIALHHAGGRPQVVAGRAPLKKNEGIRIPRILEGLKIQGIVVP